MAVQRNSDTKKLFDEMQSLGECVTRATFSFAFPSSMPPRDEAEFRTLCRSQADAFKCVKEKTKGGVPIIRRGLVSYVGNRAKHHKRYCTNLASEPSRKFLEASRCLRDKRFPAYKASDVEFVELLKEIARRNYTDATIELKRICCAILNFRKSLIDDMGAECAQHKPIIEELAYQVVSDDINLVCEEEDKLVKTCAKLEPLQFKRQQPNAKPDPRTSAPTLALYLVATLGEPNHRGFSL